MDKVKQDIDSLLKVVNSGKTELKVSHRKKYFDVAKRYSDLAQNDDTLLKDLKDVQEPLKKLHEAFSEALFTRE